MKKAAIILYGAPGSGKGTQANLISDMLGAVHLDTGKLVETTVHDKTLQKNPIIRRERKLFDTGILLTPSWITGLIGREIKLMAKGGASIVLSGSPRTLYEAHHIFPLLEKLYGKERVFAFELDVPEKVSMERNTRRLVCSICRAPLLTSFYPAKTATYCPICGGKLYKRTLDNPKTIPVRLREYKNRTQPIFIWLKTRKRKIYKLDGRPAPYLVFRKLKGILDKKLFG